MVYSDVVQRTQVYISDEELALLDRAAERTGASRSELIRRAIRERYGTRDWATRRAALQASAGSWAGQPLTGEDYVDALRGDLRDRLDRLGWS